MWRFTTHEITFALIVAAISIWIAIVVVVLMRQPFLGGDFMFFYTSGMLALRGQWKAEYNLAASHALQVLLVPGSFDYYYPQAYPHRRSRHCTLPLRPCRTNSGYRNNIVPSTIGRSA